MNFKKEFVKVKELSYVHIKNNVISGYSNATATLTFGGRVSVNPLKENCPDPKYNLVQTLATLNKANPGQVRS